MCCHALLLLAAALPVVADQRPAGPPRKKDRGLEGTWAVVSMEYQGKRVPSEFYKGNTLVIGPRTIITRRRGRVVAEATYKTFPAGKLMAVDLKETKGPRKGRMLSGIYALEGDSLKICAPDTGQRRPKEFTTRADSDHILMVLRREKS
jgi:uncharacterized protein (TIGR03067 family)